MTASINPYPAIADELKRHQYDTDSYNTNAYDADGVIDYLDYDPTAQYLRPVVLVGYQLVNGVYVPMLPHTLVSSTLCLASHMLNLELHLLSCGCDRLILANSAIC